jgi:shikimate kinase
MILKKNITLCGMPGSGKSTVGKHLAERLKCAFVDLDAFIEANESRSISDIFQKDGEPAFREMEMRYLSLLLRQEPAIIALGGGALSSEKLFELVVQKSDLIYLDASMPTLVARLSKERMNRPLLSGADWKEKLAQLELLRTPVFEKARMTADGEQNVNHIVEQIEKQLLK